MPQTAGGPRRKGGMLSSHPPDRRMGPPTLLPRLGDWVVGVAGMES